MRAKLRLVFLISLCCFLAEVEAQNDSLFRRPKDSSSVQVPRAIMPPLTDSLPKRHKVAVIAPLYLDSAFDAAGNYRYGKTMPKFLAPGVEFYQGIQLAIDSLSLEGRDIDIAIYDSRSRKSSLSSIVANPAFKGTELIIAHVNMADAQWLAHTARELGIPFVNVNFPNEAGVTNNPQYIILNSTLYTHCEGLYKFMQKNFALSPITVFRKKGVQEDRLNAYLKDIEKSTASVPLKLKYVTLPEGFTKEDLARHMNPDKTNIAFSASLDVDFGSKLAQQLATLNATSHANILVGMPNWDAINFSGTPFKGLEIIYSTPFYIAPSDSVAAAITRNYTAEYYLRPGEMVFRGFETLYHFSRLLLEDEGGFQSRIGQDRHRIFYSFNLVPVLNKKTGQTDYYENKKLYYIKKTDGAIKAVYQ